MPKEANIKVEEAVQVKQSPEVAEKNGPLQKELTQTASPSPSKLKENSNKTAQDEELKQRPADSGQAELLQCTLNSVQKEPAAADWEAFTTTPEEETPASAQDRVPDSSSSLTAEANHTEITTEHLSPDTTHDDDDEEEEAGSIIVVEKAVAEPSGESSQNNEVLSVPTSQLAAAAPSISAVGQEDDREVSSG